MHILCRLCYETIDCSIIVQVSHTQKPLHIARLQLPIVPAWAITDYIAQGKSLLCLILDIVLPINKILSSFASNYVSLSRVMQYTGLMILRPWKKEDLELKIHIDLKKEMQRLQENHEKTVTKIMSTDIYKAVCKFFKKIK